MNAESNHTASPPATAEPSASLAAAPLWLFVLMLLLLYGGAVYFDRHGGWFSPRVYAPYRDIDEVIAMQPARGPEEEMLRRGKFLFGGNCGLCHGDDGMGKPNQAPPLAGSEWVNAPGAKRMIHIPLLGLTGPIEVRGQSYNFPAGMAAMGAPLPDADLAAVLSYIRQAWGNKASPVTAEDVKAVRAEVGKRTQPLKVEELKALPE